MKPREQTGDFEMSCDREKVKMDILEGDIGKKRERPRLEYYSQLMKEIGCRTFGERKKLVWDNQMNTNSCVKPVLMLKILKIEHNS